MRGLLVTAASAAALAAASTAAAGSFVPAPGPGPLGPEGVPIPKGPALVDVREVKRGADPRTGFGFAGGVLPDTTSSAKWLLIGLVLAGVGVAGLLLV